MTVKPSSLKYPWMVDLTVVVTSSNYGPAVKPPPILRTCISGKPSCDAASNTTFATAMAAFFNFTNFNETLQNGDTIVEGQVNFSNQGIQITATNKTWQASRASYKDPLRLGNKAFGTLANFNTYFSFVIDSQGNLNFGDGLAFFLLPHNSTFKLRPSAAMGLPMLSFNPPIQTPFVAVEFDTYLNGEWDPSNVTHIGFSAGTGDYFEKHIVKSWSFNSSLQFNMPTSPSPNLSPTPSTNATSSPRKKGENNKIALVVMGLSLGSAALVGGLAFFGFVKWKKSKAQEEDGEIAHHMSIDDEFDAGIGPKKFSYAELFHATNNFTDEQKLREGGFGGVYKGFLRESNFYVAVNRISKESKQGMKEYASEVKIIEA
ncbi:hypothetical protein TEA_026477 [Camellia sinensis var. sinensis]|uniref:non-specific serine/threonine protein kinase n=1 Tax=Camellia sinensis var. sinensis TaxID=542762 RepID=A0A4S4DEB4_CAMSN|nr:hypothetical protein TEA_026477 [Camellia sinensis var. sinensis]